MSTDAARTQTPRRLRCSFRGVVPPGVDGALLFAIWGRTPRWDTYVDDRGMVRRDGQALDQLIAGPSLLRYLFGQDGDDLVAAQATANGCREEKKAAELAKGEAAGSGWFSYLQATNNPAWAVQS